LRLKKWEMDSLCQPACGVANRSGCPDEIEKPGPSKYDHVR